MRSICANSAATRPRLSHTPRRIFSISSGVLSGNAAARLARPTRCSGSHGPIVRSMRPSMFAMRWRFTARRHFRIATANQPTSASKPALRRPPARRRVGVLMRRTATRGDERVRDARSWSERHDDLAEHLPAFEPRQAALEIGERDFGVDHRGEAAGHLGEALAHIADRGAERAEDAVLLQIELEQVHLDRLAGGRAAGDEPPAALEAQERAVERVRSDMLERDVNAFLAGELAYDRLEAILAVVDDVIGPERLGLGGLLVVADGRDDGRADLLGHLDRAGADSGAAGLHQNRLARLELRVAEQHVLHGGERNRRTGGVAEGDTRGYRNYQPRRHVDEIARKAVDMETH